MNYNFTKYCLITILFLIIHYISFSQTYIHSNPIITNYHTDEIGFKPQNWNITQSKKGLIYIANDQILEYDGVNWKLIHFSDIEYCRVLHKSKNNVIYAAGQNELGILKENKYGNKYYKSLTQNLPDSIKNFGHIYSVFDYKEYVCFSGFNNILILKDTILKKVLTPHTLFRGAFCCFDKLFVRQKNIGLTLYSEQENTFIPIDSGLFKHKSIYFMLPLNKTQILIGTKNNGLFTITVIDNKFTFQPFKTNADKYIKEYGIYDGIKINDNCFAIGSDFRGVLLLDKKGQVKQLINKDNGLMNEIVNKLYLDNENNIWIALNNGIAKFQANSPVSVFSTNNGIEALITGIYEYKDTLYLSTMQNILYQTKTDTLNKNTNSLFYFKQINNFFDNATELQAINNNLYACSRIGLLQIQDKKAKLVINQSNFHEIIQYNKNPKYFLIGTADNIYLATKDSTKIFNVIGAIKNIKGEVQHFYQDSKGNVFFNISKNLYKLSFKENKPNLTPNIVKYSKNNGMPIIENGLFLHNDSIFILAKKGIYKVENNKIIIAKSFLQMIDNDSITYNQIIKINDTLLMTSIKNKGYYLLSSKSKYLPYTRTKKILSNIIPNKLYDFYYSKTKNIVYLRSSKGLYQYILDIDTLKPKPNIPIIKKVSINKDSVLFNGIINEKICPKFLLTHDNNSLIVSFTLPSFYNEKNNKYSYCLKGFMKEYSEWSNKTEVVFTNLPAGKYTFLLKAKNAYQIETKPVYFYITVLPPWYLSWWMFIIYFVLLVSIIVLIVKINEFRLRAANIRLERIVIQRTTELNKTNRALQKQNKLITDSIQYAKKIQDSIVPTEKMLQKYFSNSFLLYKPRDIVSGDFFWLTQKDNQIYLAVADCTGHGVPGAFMSMIGNTLLNEIINIEKINTTNHILYKLNQRLSNIFNDNNNENTTDDGMDISICRFFVDEKRFELSSANQPVFIVHNNELSIYNGDIFSIGNDILTKCEDKKFGVYKNSYNESTTLYFSSDGYYDQFGGKNNSKYMLSRFEQLIEKNNTDSMQNQYKSFNNEFENWKSSNKQIDDILVIGLKL